MDMIPQDNAPRKQCTGPCGRTLPTTPEFFHRNGVNSLRPDCKECRGKKVKAYYSQPEVKERTYIKRKAYRNIPEVHERIRAHKKAYSNRPEIKEHQRNQMKVYRSLPGKRERKNELAKGYLEKPEIRERHRAYDRIFQHRRRSRQRASTEHYTPRQLQEQYQRQKGKCYYCSIKLGNVYHADHVIPLSRGGSNAISNIVVACPSCNQRKQSRMPHEWPEGGRLL